MQCTFRQGRENERSVTMVSGCYMENANVSLFEAYKTEGVPALLIYRPTLTSAQR